MMHDDDVRSDIERLCEVFKDTIPMVQINQIYLNYLKQAEANTQTAYGMIRARGDAFLETVRDCRSIQDSLQSVRYISNTNSQRSSFM